MLKKISVVIICALMVLSLAGCGSKNESTGNTPSNAATKPETQTNGDTITLKLATIQDPSNPMSIGYEDLKERLAEKSGGRIILDIYYNAQLGGERDEIEGLRMGSIDITATATAALAGFMPEIAIFELPFLFRDYEHVDAVLRGEIGEYYLNKMSDYGVVGLAFQENGFRHITNNVRPIVVPGDLTGVKLRVMESDVSIATWKAAGAQPTPMAWPEVFTALQQKTIDGQENPASIIVSYKVYEVQKYLSLSKHVYSPVPMMISKMTWDKLSDEDKKIIQEAVTESTAFELELNRSKEAENIEIIRNNGVEVNEVDTEAFIAKMKPVWEQFADRFGMENINAIANTK